MEKNQEIENILMTKTRMKANFSDFPQQKELKF